MAKNKNMIRVRNDKTIKIHFTYLEDEYVMTPGDMGRFFGVGYDYLFKQYKAGVDEQVIADEAAIRGKNKPRTDVMHKRFSRRTLRA